MQIAVDEKGSTRLLSLEGEFDLAGVAEFERQLTAGASSEAATVVIDTRELAFIDSSGLRALIMAEIRLREDGTRLIVVKRPGPVTEVLELTGIAERLELVNEIPEDAGLR